MFSYTEIKKFHDVYQSETILIEERDELKMTHNKYILYTSGSMHFQLPHRIRVIFLFKHKQVNKWIIVIF